MSFGSGSAPTAHQSESSDTGPLSVGPVSGPVINLQGPGQASPLLTGGVAVAVLFAVIVLFVTMRK